MVTMYEPLPPSKCVTAAASSSTYSVGVELTSMRHLTLAMRRLPRLGLGR